MATPQVADERSVKQYVWKIGDKQTAEREG